MRKNKTPPRDYGPHYIPELDPEHPNHKMDFFDRSAWISVGIGTVIWTGAGVAWLFGAQAVMWCLFFVGMVFMIPLLILGFGGFAG